MKKVSVFVLNLNSSLKMHPKNKITSVLLLLLFPLLSCFVVPLYCLSILILNVVSKMLFIHFLFQESKTFPLFFLYIFVHIITLSFKKCDIYLHQSICIKILIKQYFMQEAETKKELRTTTVV